MNGGQTDAPEMAGKHQKMYFSFFKIALFVLPIIQIPRFIINELSRNTSIINLFTDNAKNKFGTLISLLQKQITEGVRQNQCRYVNADTILLDILSLDIAPFILVPALLTIFIQGDMTFQDFIALRTQENIMTIHCKLKST